MSSKFGQIRTKAMELAVLKLWKNLHRLIMGKMVVFDRILFIHAGSDDIHKSLDEFEIRPNLTTDYRVSCP